MTNIESIFDQDPATELVGVTAGQVQMLILEAKLEIVRIFVMKITKDVIDDEVLNLDKQLRELRLRMSKEGL